MATKKTTGKTDTAKGAPAKSAPTENAVTQETKATPKPGLKPAPNGGMLREITARPMMQGNPYMPMPATVAEVIQETGNIKTLRVVLDDEEAMPSVAMHCWKTSPCVPMALSTSMTHQKPKTPVFLTLSTTSTIS